MAQAYRSARSKNLGIGLDEILIEGCYNHDQKVVVEWEMKLTEPLLADIFAELPKGELSFKSIRASFSASCRERYADFGDSVITNFRLNQAATRSLIEEAVTRGVLAWQKKAPDTDDCAWIRPEVAAP